MSNIRLHMTAHYVTGPSQYEHLHKCCHNNYTTQQEKEATTLTNSGFSKENCHHIRLCFIFLSHVMCQDVSISAPVSVMRTVCSIWAVLPPSWVRWVQPSSSIRT